MSGYQMMTNSWKLPTTSESENLRISSFAHKNGQWNWEKFNRILLVLVIIFIASIEPPSTVKGKDKSQWK